MYFELYSDVRGEWRWRLKSSNDNIIADSSEWYVNKSDAEHGINLVQGTTNSTPVREL